MERKQVYVLILLSLLVVAGQLHAPIHAQSPNRAGLVVRLGDGSLITRCVEFSEPEISGYDVLVRSGLNVVAAFDSGMGAAVCAIEGEGCPVEECLTCAVPNYWAYWHLANGAWAYSQVGASGYKAHNGDVEGWSWGTGGPPPVVPFDQVCTPPPTDTPVPSTATSPPAMPTATSPPPTPMVWFRLDANPIPAGTCTTVRWDTDNALEVYLDGERVSADGSREVCPTALQEYRLRLVSATGEQTYTLALGVTGTPPATSTPQSTPSVAPSPTSVPQPTATASPVPSPAPSPSRTPQLAAVVSPSPSPTPSPTSRSPQPTAIIMQSATTQPAANDQPPASTSPARYVLFGLIVIGLLGLLVSGLLRRR